MLTVISDLLTALLQHGENNEKNIVLDEVFNEQTAKEAIINMLGDIAEKRTRDIYLLRFDK